MLQSPEEYVGLFRSWAAQLQKSPVTLELSCRDPRPLWPVEKCQGGSGSRRPTGAWCQASLSQAPWGSSPSSEALQDLEDAEVVQLNRGTCTVSLKHVLAEALQFAGAQQSGCWPPLVTGQGLLLAGWEASAPCCAPPASVSDLSTRCEIKEWHIAASGNIGRPTVGNDIDSWVGDRPDLLGFVSAGKQCFCQFFWFRKQRPKTDLFQKS